MKYFHLVWRNLLRRKIRTTFTALSIFVAFLLFAVLMAIRMAFAMGVEVAGVDRLMVFHKVSIIQPLPLSYWDRIRATPGVATVTHATWFGGIYQDPSNFFAQMAVDPASFLEIYSEYIVPEDQRKAWFEDRMGALVGRSTLRRFGWKIGDRIPIQGTIWRMPNDAPWTFTIRGVYDVAVKGADDTTFLFQSQALDEIRRRSFGYGMVGWYVIRVSDPAKSAEIADRIDEQFANSEYETKTDSEKAFAQSFANQVGDIGSIMTAIAAAVFFTIVLVAGNTMAQSIRERLNELAVLKTLGYSNTLVLALVLAESLALAALAGGAGLFVGWLFIRQGDPTGGLLPVFGITPQHLALGAAFAVALGIVAGTVPALKAMRLRIVDALRRT
ncbi:MAG TPA: FtsX-like permease family protein [Vicinamibacterales bacterium]|nr:FtsX-like permease family protein [Vicinamibacterales bacterium]